MASAGSYYTKRRAAAIIEGHVTHTRTAELTIDLEKGVIITASGAELPFPPLPPEVRGILESGGLVEWVKSRT